MVGVGFLSQSLVGTSGWVSADLFWMDSRVYERCCCVVVFLLKGDTGRYASPFALFRRIAKAFFPSEAAGVAICR